MACVERTKMTKFRNGSKGDSNPGSQFYRAPAWGAVAQWLERATDNRVVAGSNPAEAVWKLWQFPLPHFASVFRKRH